MAKAKKTIGLVTVIGLIILVAVVVKLVVFPERAELPVEAGMGSDPELPKPNKTLMPTVNVAPATGWPEGQQPSAAEGLRVTQFSSGLEHPRWLYKLPNGDILVAESNAPAKAGGSTSAKDWVADKIKSTAGAGVPSADRITLLRDVDNDGVADERSKFLEDLHSPFGMTLVDGTLYVANADALWSFPYTPGALVIDDAGEKVTDLPAGINHHWTKAMTASADGEFLYVGIGSNSNITERGMEAEVDRAEIWEIDADTGMHRPYATGLRNPTAMAIQPDTEQLWTVVNERDELGPDLVPDYLTTVQEGGFYGWPYSYWGQHVDPRVRPQDPEKVESAIAPDYSLGSHVAPLGLAFSTPEMGDEFAEGVFIGEHGSWNRADPVGYKVVFVPFSNGQPSGDPIDFVSGFLTDDGRTRGRPVGVTIDPDGALIIADDLTNAIWRVTPDSP